MKQQPLTPNLERLLILREEYHTQEIGEFLNWVSERGVELCQLSSSTERFEPIESSIEELLCEYIGVDKAACDSERTALLEYLRDVQASVDQS